MWVQLEEGAFRQVEAGLGGAVPTWIWRSLGPGARLSPGDLNKSSDYINNSQLTSARQERGRHRHTDRRLCCCPPPCPLLSATPASRIPAVLQLSPVGNEFHHQPATKWEDKQQQEVSRAEICAGLGSVLTCPGWKMVPVIPPNTLLSRGLRWRQIPVLSLKCNLM